MRASDIVVIRQDSRMRKPSSTADDILACARALIVAGGYNGFSYADIAENVGIRKPSIHHHFPSKAALVKTLVEGHRKATEETLGKLEQAIPGPLDQLGAYIGHWKACIGDASAPFCVCAMLATELPVLPEDVAREARAYFQFLSGWLAAVLERGATQGAIKLDDAPRVAADTFLATLHGAMLSARALGETAVFTAIMDPLLARLAA